MYKYRYLCWGANSIAKLRKIAKANGQRFYADLVQRYY